MIRVYDFVCPDGHRHERFVPSDMTVSLCPTCGAPATRAPSAPPFILDGASGHFPGKALKWEREHEKAGRGTHYED